jgi:hypothetical protein
MPSNTEPLKTVKLPVVRLSVELSMTDYG